MACIILIGLSMLGCNAAQPTTRTFGYLHLSSTPREKAFDAATQAMGERYRLESVDSRTGIITNVPEESNEIVSRGRVGDVVGVPRRVRRVATVWVTGSEESSEVWCKVLVEASESQELTLFARETSLDDAPTGTAVDRGSAATPEQNTYWRAIRREKQTERSILQAVEEIVARKSAGAAESG
jgi:hypothetical protein